jgi:hypothetical protein
MQSHSDSRTQFCTPSLPPVPLKPHNPLDLLPNPHPLLTPQPNPLTLRRQNPLNHLFHILQMPPRRLLLPLRPHHPHRLHLRPNPPPPPKPTNLNLSPPSKPLHPPRPPNSRPLNPKHNPPDPPNALFVPQTLQPTLEASLPSNPGSEPSGMRAKNANAPYSTSSVSARRLLEACSSPRRACHCVCCGP